MASAEKLLHDAQYAYQNVGYGESRDNRRAAAKARSLCKKIIRRFPASMEAGEAHAILRRLGDEAFASRIAVKHRHKTEQNLHAPRSVTDQSSSGSESVEALDWGGLFSLLLAAPKTVLVIIVFVGIFLYNVFGWVLLLPLAVLLLITGPFRNLPQGDQREEVRKFIASANSWIRNRRDSGFL